MIKAGHPPAAVWDYSPRQLQTFALIEARQRAGELAELLSLHTLAMHGKPKAVQIQVKRWLKLAGRA